MDRLLDFRRRLQGRAGIVTVASAALLLLLIVLAAFWYSGKLLEKELESRVESELTMKAILIKGMLNQAETILENHSWDVQYNLDSPDSMFAVVSRVVRANKSVLGACLAFVPNYYPEKGRLFEPFATVRDGAIVTEQIAGSEHDYTQLGFYRHAVDSTDIYWADPYIGGGGVDEMITTCSKSIRDNEGRTAAVLGIDLSLGWLGDTLNVRHLYPSSFNLLLTERGQLITQPTEDHPRVDHVPHVVSLLNDSTQKWHLSDSGRSKYLEFETDEDGATGIIFRAFMKGRPHFEMALVCYKDEIFGPYYMLGTNLTILLLGAFAVLLLIINLFLRNERKLHEATVEQERMGSELRIANKIQMDMLPEKYPPFPERNDLDVFGTLLAAKEVGGDVYDFYIRDEKLVFCIGDVSGKGVPSALVMAVTHALFRTASAHENNPARILCDINEPSCSGNESNMFVTLFVGILDLPTGNLHYANAGHDCPLLMGRELRTLPARPNLPLGVIKNYKYLGQDTRMEPGDTLFLYTDGLTEARNSSGQLFRMQRVQEVLESAMHDAASNSESLLVRMQDAVRSFADGAEQSDDLTMLAIRYTPQSQSTLLEETLELTSKVSEVSRLNSFVADVASRLHLDASLSRQVRLAVEEAVVNVMSYAYPKGTEGTVTVCAQASDSQLKFVITDRGVAFDPTETSRTDTTLSAEERPIGGLGILLVRELMDAINYERIDGRNVLTLLKSLKTTKV